MYNACRRIQEAVGFTGFYLYFVVSLGHQVSEGKAIAALTGTIQEKDAAIAKLTDEGMEIPVANVEEIPETVVREHTRQRKKKPTLEEQFKGAAINRLFVPVRSERNGYKYAG